MKFGDFRKWTRLGRDGVTVKAQGDPPRFYPWGSGKDSQARAEAEAAKTTADAAKTSADSAQTAADSAQAQADANKAAIATLTNSLAETDAKATDALNELDNRVKKILAKGEPHRQDAGISLQASDESWQIGKNKDGNSNYLLMELGDASIREQVQASGLVQLRVRNTVEGVNYDSALEHIVSSSKVRAALKLNARTDTGAFTTALYSGDTKRKVGAHSFEKDGKRYVFRFPILEANVTGTAIFVVGVYSTDETPASRAVACGLRVGSAAYEFGSILAEFTETE